LRQALDAARWAGANDEQQRRVIQQTLGLLQRIPPQSTPPEIGDQVHRLVRQEIAHGDPYREAKHASTNQALALYPRLKEMVQAADDGPDIALRLSIAGNIIDLGPQQHYDLWEAIERVLAQPFALDNRKAFWQAIDAADQILYLADNAGETVFDRVLIETLDMPVVYATKGGPVLNDATVEDAQAAGLSQCAEIVSNGSDAPGTILDCCSGNFQERYRQAQVVIAKGQANYETLSEAGDKVFFLLQCKCPVIAGDVGVPVGSIVLVQGENVDASL
jgi:uncharacterized protein with ATP-grasp and redox domains